MKKPDGKKPQNHHKPPEISKMAQDIFSEGTIFINYASVMPRSGLKKFFWKIKFARTFTFTWWEILTLQVDYNYIEKFCSKGMFTVSSDNTFMIQCAERMGAVVKPFDKFLGM